MSIAKTSIANYHSKIKGSHEDGQDNLILETIRKIQPCTGRMIEKELNYSIENSSIVRSLNNLRYKKELIISPFSAKCPVTNITVQHYTVIGEQGQMRII